MQYIPEAGGHILHSFGSLVISHPFFLYSHAVF